MEQLFDLEGGRKMGRSEVQLSGVQLSGVGRHRRPRLRLTRRGRIVVGILVAMAVAGLAALIIAVAAPASQAAPGGGQPVETVVRPDDTLWRIAARELPGVDPYRAVDLIRELNGLPDYTVQPGQHLRLPIRR